MCRWRNGRLEYCARRWCSISLSRSNTLLWPRNYWGRYKWSPCRDCLARKMPRVSQKRISFNLWCGNLEYFSYHKGLSNSHLVSKGDWSSASRSRFVDWLENLLFCHWEAALLTWSRNFPLRPGSLSWAGSLKWHEDIILPWHCSIIEILDMLSPRVVGSRLRKLWRAEDFKSIWERKN